MLDYVTVSIWLIRKIDDDNDDDDESILIMDNDRNSYQGCHEEVKGGLDGGSCGFTMRAIANHNFCCLLTSCNKFGRLFLLQQ